MNDVPCGPALYRGFWERKAQHAGSAQPIE